MGGKTTLDNLDNRRILEHEVNVELCENETLEHLTKQNLLYNTIVAAETEKVELFKDKAELRNKEQQYICFTNKTMVDTKVNRINISRSKED